jgi:hypothetical protein
MSNVAAKTSLAECHSKPLMARSRVSGSQIYLIAVFVLGFVGIAIYQFVSQYL